ncbi:sugar kinase [Rhodobacteraceae bacterium]|nr:sugar kinase [Paracoccaceae bacterium]
MAGLLTIGECMIELSGGQDALYRQGFAGDTLNTAWHARAQLPAIHDVGYFTAIGTDSMSERMLHFFEDAGLQTNQILRIEDRRPGLYMIEQKDGDRHFTYWRDQSAAKLMAQDETRLGQALASAGWLYFSGISLAILAPDARARLLTALKAAKSGGARLAFDPNIRPALWSSAEEIRTTITEAASLCDILLPSFDDEAHHFGDADPAATCARYSEATKGHAEIIVKDSGNPVHLRTPDGTELIDVPAIAQVVDATGAGDSFNGAYLAARMQGMTPRDAVPRAIATSGRVIGHHGAIPRD